jgi:exopolysaccharide biosynthesis protein
LDLPRPIRAHALRIDLSRPDLEIVVPRAEYAGAGEVHAQWPMSWLRRHQLRAVINATPFSPAPLLPGGPTRLLGLAISDGERWSEPPGNLDNFVVTADGDVRLVEARLPVGDARQGAGGFLMIRRNDVSLGEKSVLDATTVVGVSADRRWLIWLVVDGGQPGYSEGVTQHEAAEMIGQLGASDALRMDGGASSALAVADGSWIRGGRVLNRCRNPVYDGAPRPVGNVIGVRRVP